MQHPYIAATGAVIAAIVISPFLTLFYITWSRTSSVPPHLPWVGIKDKRLFAKTRACFRDITAGRKPIEEGYEVYGKNGEPFVLPGFHWPAVVLPPSNTLWLATQPENVISNAKVQDEILGLKYLSHGPDLAAVVDFTVLRRDLTRQTSRVLPDVLEEMTLAIGEQLPQASGDDWHEVKMFHIVENVSRRFNNRLFIGLPLCRDRRYISGLRTWELYLGICSAVIRHLIPEAMKPILAPLAAIPCHIQTWRLKRYLMPLIHHRVAARKELDDSKGRIEGPNDVLQWLIDAKLDGGNSTGMAFDDIAGKAILLNFFSVHTISINTGTILTNILLHPSFQSLISSLRIEAESILPNLASNPRLTRNMTKLDAVIRESMRLSNMTGRGFDREVVSPVGVTTPSGVFLPTGTHVCAAVSSRQVDDEVWERGNDFVPLRFYRGGEDGETEEASNEQAKHAVHVTEDFLSFGLGRHACPGRFFAVQAMKVMLAHLLTNYDFEPLTEKPKFHEFGDAMVPSDEATIRMRPRRFESDPM